MTLRTDGPVTGPDMVQVERAVLVELLLIAANTFGNNGYTERAFAMDQLHDDVASGERDVLTSADWLRRKGEE